MHCRFVRFALPAVLACLFSAQAIAAPATSLQLSSPDGRVSVELSLDASGLLISTEN